MEDLSSYDLDDLEAAVEEHGMTVVGRQRWDEVRTDSADLRALRKGLEGELERLRDEAAACRDEAAKRTHKVTADLALGEGRAIDRRADRLQGLLDSSGGEK